MSLYTSGSTLVVKCLIFRPYGSISLAIIMSDKDKTVFTMEHYVSFLESESKMERSQKKRASVVWMNVQNKVGWSRTINQPFRKW